MKHLHFNVETAGFYGAYWPCTGGSDCAVIAMIGDDPEDRLARSAAKWLCARGVNALAMLSAKKITAITGIRWSAWGRQFHGWKPTAIKNRHCRCVHHRDAGGAAT